MLRAVGVERRTRCSLSWRGAGCSCRSSLMKRPSRGLRIGDDDLVIGTLLEPPRARRMLIAMIFSFFGPVTPANASLWLLGPPHWEIPAFAGMTVGVGLLISESRSPRRCAGAKARQAAPGIAARKPACAGLVGMSPICGPPIVSPMPPPMPPHRASPSCPSCRPS